MADNRATTSLEKREVAQHKACRWKRPSKGISLTERNKRKQPWVDEKHPRANPRLAPVDVVSICVEAFICRPTVICSLFLPLHGLRYLALSTQLPGDITASGCYKANGSNPRRDVEAGGLGTSGVQMERPMHNNIKKSLLD